MFENKFILKNGLSQILLNSLTSNFIGKVFKPPHVFQRVQMIFTERIVFFFLYSTYLVSTQDNSLSAIIALNHALHIVAFAVRTPVRLFRVIRFHGILTLHFQGNDKVRAWILIRTSIFLNVARHDEEVSINRGQSVKRKKIP